MQVRGHLVLQIRRMAELDAGAGVIPVRIFVGGLAAGVTAADIEKTFSSLGTVTAVEQVCTNGRSFAFVDFQPKSDKCLSKLFGTYNGCMWKGGKLRVERAKEHYLACLRREWEQDAELASSTLVDLNAEKVLDKPRTLETLKHENAQLKIFFPKLRMVKLLPLKGTGKHKYSFQRIEVPPLPLHFCDCEEHNLLSEAASKECFSSIKPVIGDKELSIMNTVMKKLFEKDGEVLDGCSALDAATDSSVPLDNQPVLEETEETEESDVDNLVTNIGLQGRQDSFDQILLKGMGKLPANQESKSSKLQTIKDDISKKDVKPHKSQRTGGTNASKETWDEKNYPLSEGEVAENEIPILPRKRKSQDYVQEVEILGKAQPLKSQPQTEQNENNIEPTKGNTWLQKSSWKDLVGEIGNGSFSISHVLPGINSVPPKSTISDASFHANSAAPRKRKMQTNREESSRIMVVQQENSTTKAEPAFAKKPENGSPTSENPMEGAHEAAEKTCDPEPKRTVPKISIGEVCTFMRSAESEKEWSKAKAVLSGFLKKKANVNDANTRAKDKKNHKH